MKFEHQFKERIKDLDKDTSICAENKAFFKDFLDKEAYKLRRKNNLGDKLDEGCYKTLYYYLVLFNNINKWFHNKPLKNITERDFKRFYDDFEDGRIVNQSGKPYKAGTRKSYYSKVFRSKPFEMLGKSDIVRNVMEFHQNSNREEVRFIVEEDFRKIIGVCGKLNHKLLLWLCFDLGENINAILKLKKSDFNREIDKDTNIPEYRVELRREILKRSRTPRTEITNYKETVELLDVILSELKEDQKLFDYDYRNAKKIISRAADRVKAKCTPKGQAVTFKDLRSSMACDLLKKGWTLEEVNARLGHKPSSREIDKYISFLALDKHKPKKKVYEHNLAKLQDQVSQMQERDRLQALRIEAMQKKIEDLSKSIIKQGILDIAEREIKTKKGKKL